MLKRIAITNYQRLEGPSIQLNSRANWLCDIMWQQRDLNPELVAQPFSQTVQMIELCCIYLCSAFDCMLLLCHVRVSEWIYTL